MQHVVMRQVIAGLILAAAIVSAQGSGEFDAASIRWNQDCSGGRGVSGGRGGVPVPGRFSVKCFTVQDYIEAAYSMFADGVSQSQRRMQIFGAPEWSLKETWDIEARAQSDTPVARMYGPMLQKLLEDRFRLKIHRKTRQLPVYVLTVAKNGPRLKQTKEGSCDVLDLAHLPAPDQQPALPRCGSTSVSGNHGRMVVDGRGLTISTLVARSFYTPMDRPVIDQTGLAGMFDIHLEYAGGGASPDDTSTPALVTALQDQLGLKLTADRGPVEVLVIDRLEKPSEN